MANYLTVVMQLPDDSDSRKKITAALGIGCTFHGARITGMSLEDEMTLNEQLIELSDPALVEEAQAKAAAVHQAALA